MYYFEMLDAVMFTIVMLLIIAIAVSVTHSIMSVKLQAVSRTFIEGNADLREYNAKLLHDWSIASVYMYVLHDIAVIYGCYNPEKHPNEQLADLLSLEAKMAVDPAISREANQLINKAKREHGKKIRKAADRKLERFEREYEARINSLQITVKSMQQSNTTIRANMGEIRSELTAFQGITMRVLDNFVRLPSVRKKMIESINQQHQAWKDL